MLSGRTLLASTAIAVFVGSALAADDGASLSGNREQTGPQAAESRPAVDVEWDNAIMILAGELQLVEDETYTRGSLSEGPSLSSSGKKSERRYKGPQMADSQRQKPVAGHCGNDDFPQDWDAPRLSTAPTIIEFPFTLSTDSDGPSFISLDRLSADFDLYQAEFSKAENDSPEIIGEIFIGENDRFSLGSFSATKEGTRLRELTRVRVDKVRMQTIRLRLSANSSLVYTGEFDWSSLLKVVDHKGKPVGHIVIDWENASSEQDDDETFTLLGDLTNDGMVNTGDFNALLAAWGTQEGDLNGDGNTNGQDLGIMLGLMEGCWG